MRYTGPDFPGADIKSGDLVLVSDDKILEDGAVYIVEIGDMMYLAQIFFIENNQIVIKAPGGFSWVGENRSDYFHAPPPGDMESPYIIGKATHVLRRIAHVNKQ